MKPTPNLQALDDGARRYLDLLKACLTRDLFLDQEWWDVDLSEWPDGRDDVLPVLRANDWRLVRRNAEPDRRDEGRDWPPSAETMIGTKRLDNVLHCAIDAIQRSVPGDFVETGVWRGGVTILMRGVLAAMGDTDRTVWAADSFEGLPVPDADKHPADAGLDWSEVETLKVDVETVRSNFARYGLLDGQVEFLVGWFADTLPVAPIEKIALLRLDGDLYGSTLDALEALYPKVSPGGFVLVDDYGGWESCRRAVDDYRDEHRITVPINQIDWTGVWWQVPEV